VYQSALLAFAAASAAESLPPDGLAGFAMIIYPSDSITGFSSRRSLMRNMMASLGDISRSSSELRVRAKLFSAE
jgi:hypothetical protein